MLSAIKITRGAGRIVQDVRNNVPRAVAQNQTTTWTLLISNRSHLSLTTCAKADEKKPELFIDHVLKDFADKGIQNDGDKFKAENAFKLFQLEERLMISESKLKREMLKLQRTIHPDKYINAGRETHEKTGHLASLVNESYETLKHPYKRAKYLLSLKWNKSQYEIEQRLDGLQLDPDFLSNMMDLRELIDNTHGIEKLKRLSADVQYDLEEIIQAIDKDFKAGKYESVLDKLGKLKFIANCHIALSEKLGNLGEF